MIFIITSAISAVLTSTHRPSQLTAAALCHLPVCDSGFSVDWLLLVLCNQSDHAVGGTLSEAAKCSIIRYKGFIYQQVGVRV